MRRAANICVFFKARTSPIKVFDEVFSFELALRPAQTAFVANFYSAFAVVKHLVGLKFLRTNFAFVCTFFLLVHQFIKYV